MKNILQKLMGVAIRIMCNNRRTLNADIIHIFINNDYVSVRIEKDSKEYKAVKFSDTEGVEYELSETKTTKF